MVMCIKYRKNLLKLRERVLWMKQMMWIISEKYGFDLEAIGSDGDHVHIFVGATGRWAPSRIMQILKSISAREMFQKFPEIKKQLWGGEFWSDGGYIGTVGEGTTEDIVKKYIERQGTDYEESKKDQLSFFNLRS